MTTTTQNYTPETFAREMIAAYHQADARYKAHPRNAREAERLGDKMQKDIARGLKFWAGDRAQHIAKLALATCDAENMLRFVRNEAGVKACLRLPEFLDAIVSRDYQKLDIVTTLDIISAACAGGSHRDALRFAATGKGDEFTSDLVKNIALVRRVQKFVGTEKTGSEQTRVSRSFGKNGFAGALGLGRLIKNEHGQTVLQVDTKHKLFKQLVNMLETASDHTLELMGAKKGNV